MKQYAVTGKWSSLVLLAFLGLTGCGGGGGGSAGPTAPVSINLWTWESGSNIANPTGVYGPLGSPSQGYFPGGRESAVSWTDANGDFWLFGGLGTSGLLNDLWKFDANKQWTWVSGNNVVNQMGVYSVTSGTATTMPGARRGAVSWIDQGNNLWFFGGFGIDSVGAQGDLNDLWKFDSNKQWTWVSGTNIVNQMGVYSVTSGTATSMPGAREGAVSWIDNKGNLWLFGGKGYDSTGIQPGDLNDLWKFDPTTGNWTWVNGYNVINQRGSGALGVTASTNIPGARHLASSWIDVGGNLWLFGGNGFAVDGTYGDLNDLWKFDSANSNWTWVNGNISDKQTGVYSLTTGVASSTNSPGARESAVSWVDGSSNLWLFGGYGLDSSTTLGYLNDLWKFNGTDWVWMSGGNIENQKGIYGSLGIVSIGNIPGARHLAVSWIDKGGNLWLFGGVGVDSTGTLPYGDLNDLWRYQP